MGVSSKITQILTATNKRKMDLAKFLGLGSPQAMTNKLARGSWSVEDLIKVAIFTGSQLSLHLPDGVNVIQFTEDDLKK